MTHSNYRNGCRCQECTAAHAARIKRQRAARRHRRTNQEAAMITSRDIPPIHNGACQLPRTAFDTRIDQQTRATYGAENDRVFFPNYEPGRPAHNRQIEQRTAQEAKTICQQECAELATCREWILNHEARQQDTEAGIWGGLTERERGTILTKRLATQEHVA